MSKYRLTREQTEVINLYQKGHLHRLEVVMMLTHQPYGIPVEVLEPYLNNLTPKTTQHTKKRKDPYKRLRAFHKRTG